MNIAVFCSGRGTNLQAIIDAVREGKIKAQLRLAVGDVKDAYCLRRARDANIKTIFIDPEKFKTKEAFDKEVMKYLEEEKIDLVVLAGFMRILSSYFVKKYRDRILNIHPALLPSFKGTEGIKDVWEYGVKVTGVTVHFVNEELDSGPIILQEAIRVEENDTIGSLEEKIHKVEHRLYPEAIRLFCEKKLAIEGRKVKILFAVFGILFLSFMQCQNVFAENAKIRNYYSTLPPELSIEKSAKFSLVEYKKSTSAFFFLEEDRKKDSEWRSLTEKEFKQKTKELTYSSIKATAEFFDSIYMPYISRGLFNIIGTAYRVDKYRQEIEEKRGIGISTEMQDSKIYLTYKREY